MRHVNASTQHNAPIIDPVKPPEHMNADEQVVEVHSHGSSGVGVLDKATLILDCLEAGPVSLGDLVKATGLARPTAHDPASTREGARPLLVTSARLSAAVCLHANAAQSAANRLEGNAPIQAREIADAIPSVLASRMR